MDLRVPRTRGDEPSAGAAVVAAPVEFPAHAGMNRDSRGAETVRRRVPRTRGDEPQEAAKREAVAGEFPAHAGMNRGQPVGAHPLAGVPRTRGDEPSNCGPSPPCAHGVPRTRGDEPVYVLDAGRHNDEFPAHAGMNRGSSCSPRSQPSSSPHTRG